MILKFLKIIIPIVLVFVFLPSTFSSAQTFTPDFQTVIKQLQDQIKLLNQQILDLQSRLEKTEEEVKVVKAELKLTRTLRKGESSDEVKQLQEFLKQFPDIYPEGKVTGFFGSLTELAVKRFQEKNGIESIGIVGPKTIQKLNEFSISGPLAIPAIPAVPGVSSAIPAIPASLSLPFQPASASQPAVPAIPAIPAVPAIPGVSSAIPAVPATPAQPASSTSTSTPSVSASPSPTASASYSPTPIPTPIPTPTPTPTPAASSQYTMQGVDGTWCIDGDINAPDPTLPAGWPGGAGNIYTKSSCQDQLGTYYDYCSSGNFYVYDYGCWYSTNGAGQKINVKCSRYTYQVIGTYLGNSGYVCSDGGLTKTAISTPTPSPTPAPTPTPAPVSNKPATVTIEAIDGTWCYDSDRNNDQKIKGSCQDNAGTYYDYCSGGTVYEYVCQGFTSTTVKCAGGADIGKNYICSDLFGASYTCSNGACVNIPTPTPTPASTASVSFSPSNIAQISAMANILNALKSILQTLSNLIP